MTENLDVRARLSAIDGMTPVLRQVLAELKKFDSLTKEINDRFSGLGRAGVQSFDGINRVAQAATAQMRGMANTSRATARNFESDWRKATDQRLADLKRLERAELNYLRLVERRATAERRADSGRGGFSGGLGAAGRRIPTPRLSTIAIGGGIIGAGIAGVLKKRMETEAAEVRAKVFGELTQAEIEALRKGFANSAGIKFGVGTSKALDVATEGLKAGIAKQFAADFGELALKAQSGLDIPVEDTAKLMGRLSSQMAFDKTRYSQILNAIAVANNSTAADGKEIVEALRRSLSALATTKMTPEQLAALDSTAISLGIQPFKAGTFMSFLTSQIAGADSATGKPAQDLASAANVLGFGGRNAMATKMRASPIEAIQQILDKLAQLPEKLRTKVARQLANREWMDELLTMVLGRDKLREVLQDIANKPGFLDSTYLQKIKSMQGRWASVKAAFDLAWEKAGAGLESMFDQITDGIIDLADKFNWDSIKDHFSALVTGLREGFGLKNWGEVITSLANQFDAGTIDKWKAFGKGMAEGFAQIANGLKTAFNMMAYMFGGEKDAEGLGNFVARLTRLSVALAVLSPAVTLFAATITALAALNPFTRMALGLFALAAGVKRVLDYIADKIFSVFVSVVDAVKNVALSIINAIRGFIGLDPIGGRGHGASGSWEDGPIRKQSFLGTSQTNIGRNIMPASFGLGRNGIVRPENIPSFSGTGGSVTDGGAALSRSAFERKFAGTPLAGKYDQIVAAAEANGISPTLLAGVMAHETGNGTVLSGNNPGGIMDPASGMARKMRFADLDAGISKTGQVVAKTYKRAGGDLDKLGGIYAPPGAANDPRGLNAGWAGGVRNQMNALSGAGGYAGSGDAVAWAQQYKGMNEYTDTRVLAAVLGGDVRGRSNAWCARFVNKAIEAAGGRGTGSAVANSFMRYGRAIDPAKVMRNDILLQPNGRGYNQRGGHVGLSTGETRMVNGRLQLKMIAGNDGDSVREHWIDADRNLMVRRGNSGLTSQVPPSEMIQNVPQTPSAAGGGMGPGVMRGGYGPTQIHINGSSHDPEALATLVQRRIDESMNWRTNDTSSEYT